MRRDSSVDAADTPTRFPARPPADSVALQLFLVVSLATLWCTGAMASERTPAEQLARMSHALRSLNYQGTVVYLHGNRLEALKIAHSIDDGHIRERLLSLNGPVRTLTREKGSVTCDLSNSHSISVRGQGAGKDVFHAWTLDPEALSNFYSVHPLGKARVAGRQTEVVGIIPQDNLRYGYRFYLDRESGLPLKSDLMGQQVDPIEQVMFTSLDILPSLEPAPTKKSPTSRSNGATAPTAVPNALPPDSFPWRFEGLPPGFLPVMHDSWLDPEGQRVEHILLSDGLASVSVYFESNPKEGLVGGTRIGAVHAAGSRIAGHQVTAVGEVPRQTVELVLSGTRYVYGGQR